MEQYQMTPCERSYKVWMQRNKGKGTIKEKEMFRWAFERGMNEVMSIFKDKLKADFKAAHQEGIMRNVWRIEEFNNGNKE